MGLFVQHWTKSGKLSSVRAPPQHKKQSSQEASLAKNSTFATPGPVCSGAARAALHPPRDRARPPALRPSAPPSAARSARRPRASGACGRRRRKEPSRRFGLLVLLPLPPPAAPPCPRCVRCILRTAAERPDSKAERGAVWTGAAGWGRVGPQGCPGAQASGRAIVEGWGGGLLTRREAGRYVVAAGV